MLTALAFAAINGLLGLCCSRLAARLSEDRLEQLVGSMLLAFFWLTTASLITAWAGYYQLAGMAVLLTPLLIASMKAGRAPASSLYAIVADGLRWVVQRRECWVLFLPQILFLCRLLWPLSQPPRAWDTLIYHLPHAAFWVQDAGFARHEIPGSWLYYGYYAPAGDFLWAWTMLAGAGDALLFAACLWIWVLLNASLIWLGRSFGLTPARTALAAAIILSAPAVMLSARSALVDVLVAALLAAALAAALRAAHSGESRWLLLGTAILALTASTKFTGVPLLAIFLLYATWQAWRGRRLDPGLMLALACATLPYVIWTGWLWTQTGSLTYPFQLLGGQFSWLRGNEAMLLELRTGSDARSPQMLLKALFGLCTEALNLGIPLSFLLPMAIWSLRGRWAALRRPPALLLLAFAAVPVAGAFAPANTALIGIWGDFVGRHLVISLTLVVLAAAMLPYAWADRALRTAIFLNVALVFALPGWSIEDQLLMMQVALPWLASLAVLAVLGYRLRHHLPTTTLQHTSLLLAVITFWWLCLPLRDRHRHDFYAIEQYRISFEITPGVYGGNFEPWRYLDQPTPLRIAYSTDINIFPPSWFIYPYFGTRLQNHVQYVGPWNRPVAEKLDADAGERIAEEFRRKLAAWPSDYLVLAGELPIERRVTAEMAYPEVLSASDGKVSVYRTGTVPVAPVTSDAE